MTSSEQITHLSATGLSAWYADVRAVSNLDLRIDKNSITAIIGPSGSGKTTLIRCFNRMHELLPGSRVEGDVHLAGDSIYSGRMSPSQLRQKIGMVFERPSPFPTMSIADNVLAGLRLTHRLDRRDAHELVEDMLSKTGLWDELKDRLSLPGTSLSSGQMQRLCIARALAVEPDILLLDEPCASLDPIATARIEDLLRELSRQYTIVLVTHNLRQATRVSTHTAFMLDGELIEFADTNTLFTSPRDDRTEDYITGKFG